MSTKEGRIHSLDALRAFAVLWVVATHAHTFPPGSLAERFAGWGALGVDLFFVLSGYLIAAQWFRDLQAGQGSFRDFFIKRAFRIWPNYFFLLALFVLFPALQGGDLSHLWRYALFVQNFYPEAGFGITWSLCIEEHFYLAFPFVAFLAFRHGGKRAGWVILFFLMASILARFFSWWIIRPDRLWLVSKEAAEVAYYSYFYHPTYTRLDGLLFGVSLAAIERFRPVLWGSFQAMGSWWFALASALAVLTVALGSNSLAALLPPIFLEAGAPAARGLLPTTFSVFGFDLAFACVVAGALSKKSVLYRIRIPLAGFLAATSYAMYLTHSLVIFWLSQLADAMGWETKGIGISVAVFLACTFFAWVLYAFVEQPFMRMRRFFLGKHMRSGKPVVSGTAHGAGNFATQARRIGEEGIQ